MSRHSDDPVKHVISFRVNHEEKLLLKKIASQYRCSVSDLLRRNLRELTAAEEKSADLASRGLFAVR